MSSPEILVTKSSPRVAGIVQFAARCECCTSARASCASNRLCAECLERARPHDAADPYDELGGGD
jgi:hypothetical protein